MDHLLDIIVIALVVAFAAFGYHKGIIRSVISLISTLLSSLMSTVLSKPIAEAIYNGSVKPIVLSKSEDTIKLVHDKGLSFIDSFTETMPEFIVNSLNGFGLTSLDIHSAAQFGAAQIERTVAPIVISFLSVITSVLLFFLLRLIAGTVQKLIDRALEEKHISFIDSFTGAVVGIAEAFIIVLLAAFVIRTAQPHLKNPPEFISEAAISKTVVFKGIYNSPIITGLVSSVTDSPNLDEVN